MPVPRLPLIDRASLIDKPRQQLHILRSTQPEQLYKNVLLFLLSLFFLPLDTAILFYGYARGILRPGPSKRQQRRCLPNFRPRTILVTGVGMEKALCLARMFYEAGHDVIGADFESDGIPVRGRVSRALKKFYRLSEPDPKTSAATYIQDLLTLIRRENVELWVTIAEVSWALEEAQAKEIVERRTHCRAIQFDLQLTEMLHAKDSFISHTASIGLNVPDTHLVESRTAVHKILNNAPEGQQYVLKKVGIDIWSRGGLNLVPRSSPSETYQQIAAMEITPEKPWVLQQFIRGKEYCTHTLVVDGVVKLFVACPSNELLMHYEALPPNSGLSMAMQRFTEEYVKKTDQRMTGHLSFDIMIEERSTPKGVVQVLYPIECNPRAHTALLLFDGQADQVVNAYLSALAGDVNGMANGSHSQPEVITVGDRPGGYFWVGHDLVTLLLQPLVQWVQGQISRHELMKDASIFLQHLLTWDDGTYLAWDPLPWWWLYHVYWPMKFLLAIWTGKRWTRANISTTTFFRC
ncbi:MAG: hypothetical protein M1823_005833 [Watsoniomyces obsoletus]|nr:MAG: hypothetical protein M1823_005833 [Watsoniomyces obsoletus]